MISRMHTVKKNSSVIREKSFLTKTNFLRGAISSVQMFENLHITETPAEL